MAGYIDRTVLLNHLKDCKGQPPEMCYTFAVLTAIESFVKSQPAADVAPVVHGCWVSVNESQITGFNPEFAGCDPAGDYICSRCGGESIFDCNDKFVLSKYCPHCGAKMDLEESK